jgi:hypothetical protein
MNKKIITKAVFILLGTAGTCWAGCCTNNAGTISGDKQADAVEVVLKQLSLKTKQLKSYQCQVGYRFVQPVFESTTLRKGFLYYAKSGKKSKLRINFGTLKQDDEKEQKYREDFIFDGVWLTHINYQIKQVRMHQLTEPNKPVDAFELASKNLPIVGFAKIEDLKKQFEIKLVEQEKGHTPVIPAKAGIHNFIHLHLKVKPDSVYKDKYVSIDFWIDKKLHLPAKIVAVSTEPADVPSIEKDSYQIKLLKPKVNKRMDNKVFEFRIPRGFGKPEIIPLKKKTK